MKTRAPATTARRRLQREMEEGTTQGRRGTLIQTLWLTQAASCLIVNTRMIHTADKSLMMTVTLAAEVEAGVAGAG